jgi:hypothetical protein
MLIYIILFIIICTFIFILHQKKQKEENKHIGGCAGTRYGCCPHNITSKQNAYGTNCHTTKPIGGCSGTRYGCCPNNITPKQNYIGSNC